MLEKFLNELTRFATDFGLKLIAGILILVVGWKLVNWLVKKTEKTSQKRAVDQSVHSFIKSGLSISLKVLLVITVAGIFGVPMTSIIAVIGSAGLAIGLALQGSLSNLAGGLMILIFKPFVVGDYIETGGLSGTVKSITIFYTKLITPDNCKVVIPNSQITANSIENYSAYPTRRVDLKISADYGTDIDKVRSVLLSAASKCDMILSDPEPEVWLGEHADSSLNFYFRTWCRNEDYWKVKFFLLEEVKKSFDKEGISIPFPQLDVHINNK